jgi:hypothetical protein
MENNENISLKELFPNQTFDWGENYQYLENPEYQKSSWIS